MKGTRSSTTLAALTAIVMTEVNSTSTTIGLVCRPPFKVEAGKERESEKGRFSTSTSVFVSQRLGLGTHRRLIAGGG